MEGNKQEMGLLNHNTKTGSNQSTMMAARCDFTSPFFSSVEADRSYTTAY